MGNEAASEADSAPPAAASSSGLPPRNKNQLRLPKFTSIEPPNKGQSNDGQADSSDEEESGDSAAFFAASSAPQTPNITEAAQHLRRSLSIHGLHELSNMPSKEIRRSVGNKVWRPHDEIAKLPGDWERLAVHVFRGGVRAWNLAYGLRATIMLVLALIKGLRSRKLKGKDLRSAVFSVPNFRFALMFALWASIYKTVHNSLRLITPVPRRPPRKSQSVGALDTATQSTPPRAEPVPINTDPRPHSSDYGSGDESTLTSANRSGTATPRSGYEELKGKSEEDKAKTKSKQKKRAFMSDPRSKIWHAYVAGAVSAVAVMVETKDSRVSLAQQLLVRGLEGTYNVAHEKKYINIPHGAVLAFGLACGQIMWAWLNAPDTLPRGYINWITNASMIAPSALPVHRAITNKSPLDVDAVLKPYFPSGKIPDPRKSSSGALRFPHVPRTKINRRGIAADNVALIAEWAEKARKGDLGATVPCSLVHPWESSHFWSPFDRFFEVVRWILPVYMTLYFVPAVFLRTGSFLKNPLRVFLRSAFGSLRSSSFLGAFVIIFQTLFCAAHSLHDRILLSPYLSSITPTWLLAFLKGTSVHWLAGFATSASLFVDHARRRAELAAYVLPKGMESAWSIARKRGWAPFVPGGDLLLTSVGMSLVMGTYARSPDHLSGLVRRIVYQFIGRN
ncbi:hypothetical protein BCV69DRAFT_314517 [Microstroma glucosiphilum]|uniref:Transmembrane protein 135 N-terminal domain-containing protein n=1 Tax=Pseudomicrostroma glucosiphilum TaxID=1684307 RepID=A0A316U2L5_9BASI|nr:hypothetical protein BCV69DRAFT_314517 [Pseudomicrostroma glucosiphilum]PWN18633.1 hypothetical protein BCV69DRAFT_314517 [Pseudomicrostroma glucosiphilum]